MKKMNRHFSKEDIQMASRYMEKCSMLLIIRKIQIKTTMTCNLTPVVVVIIKKTIGKCWLGCKKRYPCETLVKM